MALAVAGFARTGWAEFGQEEPVRVLGVVGVSTLLNIVHAAIGGLAGVAALRGSATAFGVVATIAFTALAVFGAVARIFGGRGDPLNLTWWNVALYLLSAAGCVFVYSLRVRAARTV